MLLDIESEESAVTSGIREGVGVLVDRLKRRGWALSSTGRRERWERMDEALRARIMLEYSMSCCSARKLVAGVTPGLSGPCPCWCSVSYDNNDSLGLGGTQLP